MKKQIIVQYIRMKGYHFYYNKQAGIYCNTLTSRGSTSIEDLEAKIIDDIMERFGMGVKFSQVKHFDKS